jgi:hypothetical protein
LGLKALAVERRERGKIKDIIPTTSPLPLWERIKPAPYCDTGVREKNL